jgi:hypothetical protein
LAPEAHPGKLSDQVARFPALAPDVYWKHSIWLPVSRSELLSDIESKHVRISGRTEMYNGKPEIRINAASQLEVE